MGSSNYLSSSGWNFFSPILSAMGKIFCLGGNGQVACTVKAQGGLKALLKSMTVWPVASGFGTYINLPVG